MKRTLISAILPSLFLVLISLPSIFAATVEEEEIELQMRAIAKTLRCTVCQNESIWESQAPLAQQMRDLVRERLIQGETPDEIRAYFQSRYGDYILLAPRKKGLNWLLWAGPFVLLIVGGGVLYRMVSRWVTMGGEKRQEPPPPVDDRLRKRIEEELQSRED